ncbi:hypothetical protein BRADI_3g30233v3 [Brachypodium distachyon]|uniref:Uncharacterized protein n=1 Tax=Brachypodium distachyon TaxID=15368 RepID=A0A0Q3Q6R5_BRADI|nr:hypothetical protein BRADI_3g30233v3 [Brachypodium distachyon]
MTCCGTGEDHKPTNACASFASCSDVFTEKLTWKCAEAMAWIRGACRVSAQVAQYMDDGKRRSAVIWALM